MKKFNSPIKNAGYLAYRLVNPLFDPVKFVLGVINYPKYIYDYHKFKKMSGQDLKFEDLFPVIDENTPFTKFDYHYFYQQLWVFEEVLKNKPAKHVDVGSTYEMSGYISTIVPTDFVDIRPTKTTKENLTIVNGSVTQLPYADNSLPSVSCLHVLEHIGLGRYGDPIDPEGINKAVKELVRVLQPGGFLYISTPIGKERVCFNGHRVNDAENIVKWALPAELVQFNLVDDEGNYLKDQDYKNCSQYNYALGMFKFIKR